MNRRNLAQAIGVAALAGLARSSWAQHEQHSHAASTSADVTSFPALLAATSDCVEKGQSCLAHCIRLLSTGNKSMSDCATSVNQMLALCRALESLAAQGSQLTPSLARVALEACTTCSEACKPHVEHHSECKACYESCLECIKQCKAVA